MGEAKDRESFDALFRRHYRAVIGFFVRKGFDEEEARDLTQETFVRVCRGLERYRGEAQPRSWIFAIARNVYRNEIRARRAAKRASEEAPLEDSSDALHTPSEDASPLEELLATEDVDLLDNAMRTLPPRMRQCFLLRLRGLRAREIAAVLGVAVPTVKTQLFQARKRLREQLTGHDRTSSE